MYTDEFIEGLSDDPIEAVKEICDFFLTLRMEKLGNNLSYYDEFIEAYALLSAFIEEHNLNYKLPSLTDDRQHNILSIVNSIDSLRKTVDKDITENSVAHMKSNFKHKFKNAFSYQFSEGDIQRIQTLINELREHITKYEGFEEEHRQRLLRRLEKLQSELHKKVSDLDRFWGLIGDAGVVLGKFGDDAKPFVDRIREIANIVWRTQSRAEELPSGTNPPLISQDNIN